MVDEIKEDEANEPGKIKPDGKGGQEMDSTHSGERGSLVFGRIVADELRKVEPTLAAVIK